MENEMELEYSLLKAPHEGMNKAFRQSHKLLEKEMAQVSTVVSELVGRTDISTDEAHASLDKLVTKLQGLKRKLEESKKEEEGHIQRFKARVDHIKAFYKKEDPESLARWHASRVDRVMVDYMLREGLYEPAIQLAREANIVDLVDIDIFVSSRKVIEGLKHHDCTEALQWCADNRSKLKKIRSNLEFSLRIQEFVELVRASKLPQAIGYARKHLSPCATTNMEEIQKAMATLAFLKDTSCPRYQPLFDIRRWEDLVAQFKHDCYALFSLTATSLLSVSLEAGLSALKTPMCADSDSTSKNTNCPVCNEQFNKIAKDLPCALHSHSRLVCRITGDIMNEDNPPMVLPNGQAYSKKGLNELAAKNNGRVVCPQTGVAYKFEELKKAFIT